MNKTFPQYRSLEGFQRHYKIIDERTFQEAVYLNGRWKITEIKANQYPEMLRIQDMIQCKFSYKKAAPEIAQLFEKV